MDGAGAGGLVKVGLAHLHLLQILFQRAALAVQALAELQGQLVDLLLDHAFGQHTVHLTGGLGEDLVLHLDAAAVQLVLQDALPDAGPEGLQVAVKILLGKGLVDLGRIQLKHQLGGDVEGARATGQFGGVILGEGHVDIPLFAGADALDALFQLRQEGLAAQHQHVVLGVAAGDGLAAVHGALQVQAHAVALPGGAVQGGFLAGTAGVFLQQEIQLGLLHLGHGDVHLDLAVVAQLHLGIGIVGGGEPEALGAGGAGGDVGIAHHIIALLGADLLQGLGTALLGGLGIEELLAQGFLGLFPGDLALGGALQLQLGLAQLIGGLQSHREIFGTDQGGDEVTALFVAGGFQQLLVHRLITPCNFQLILYEIVGSMETGRCGHRPLRSLPKG